MAGAQLSSARVEFDSWNEVVEGFMDRGWTDGLPIIPPTPDLVNACLEAGGRNPADILASQRIDRPVTASYNRVRERTVTKLGFKVVAAAVEAMSEPQFNLHAITASTQGAAVLAIVNGPIVDEIGLNSGVSVFGPGHRENATIGRAIRLVIINATGSQSGEIDKATLGHPGKYTWCMAEAESVSPWEPFQTGRGFTETQSTISLFAALSPIQVDNHAFQRPEEILVSFREAMYAGGGGWNQGEVVVVLCPEHVGNLERAGWSKEQVREFLHGSASRPIHAWQASGRYIKDDVGQPDDELHSVTSADGISVVVAGGGAGAFSCVIPLWSGGTGSRSVTKLI